MTTPIKMLEAIKLYENTKFHHQGRVRGVGVDCAGLLVCAARDAGYQKVPDLLGYRRSPDGKTLEELLGGYLVPVPDGEELQLGDILLFKLDGTRPQHLGIVTRLNPHYMMHAYSVSRKVCEHRIDDVWFNRLVRAYRLPKQEV